MGIKDLTNPKLIKPLTNAIENIQHTNDIVQIEFGQSSIYLFSQEFISKQLSTSNSNLNSVIFTPNILIPIYQK